MTAGAAHCATFLRIGQSFAFDEMLQRRIGWGQGGMTISMAGLPAFLLYFVVGVALIAAFAVVYQRMTAHDEIALIRGGNLSAAIAFGGNVVGFSIPLEKAIEQASSIADCVLWAIAAMIIQFAAYGLARVAIPNLSKKIEEDHLPAAAMLALIAVVSGTLAGASMTE